ncbi:hypothetical protein LOTGIDRAFT_228694 [Lottia gigantea]|uniref:Uncharacterized protein n=1 Tax=Lottia gigantea TaxID=225164 RepID=V4ACR1_LOTGI|nr:hypothetical protein LOTGIDRAFT_228694 [Lottia gigantea]ESO91111.1 hypothetical protein LOTGIDRAFT_228694 [Lottia gigantea]
MQALGHHPICALLVLVSTVNADIDSDYLDCMYSQETKNGRTRCTDAFSGPSPQAGPTLFFSDPEISNYSRLFKAEYIKWAICYNSVEINCYKPEYQDLAMSNCGIQSAIEYFFEREADGNIFDHICEGFNKSNTEFLECFRQLDELTTPSTGNITYEGYKYNLCRRRLVDIDCYRNNNEFKQVCSDTQTTFTTILEKQLPHACDAGNDGNNGYAGNNTRIWSLIVITYLISLFNN